MKQNKGGAKLELLTRNQYMKRFNLGYEKLQRMIAKKEVDYLPEADRIKIAENVVSITLYEEEKAKRIKAEEKLLLLKNVINS